jgi:hypothetical protein
VTAQPAPDPVTAGFWSLTHTDDVMTLQHGEQYLGVLTPHTPDGQTRTHAESLAIPFGEWRQLTGRIFAFALDTISYHQLTGCLGYCGRGALRCPKARG